MVEGELSNTMTVVGLVNGMIGGIILIMPILALKTGVSLIAPLSVLTGFFSYYSCLLCLKHLRNYKDLDEAILRHFGNRKAFKIFYDITIVISLSVLLILYFDLICKQWEGMIHTSILVPILNSIALFPIIYILKKFHFGATLLAYGILSIIGYCAFLVWMWVTAPDGIQEVQVADTHFLELGSALAQGFAIQSFFIPILKQNPNRNRYGNLLILTYIIGIGIYTFIGYSGALSLINRKYPGKTQPQTIQDYFENKQWQVYVVEILYLIHLYSAFPEFLLIAKRRFFGIFNWPDPKNISIKQLLYITISIGVCFAFKVIQLSVDVLVELNGSIISFIFVYVIPIGLHVKCKYFVKDRSYPLHQEKQIKQGDNKNQDNIEQEKQSRIEQMVERKQSVEIQMELKSQKDKESTLREGLHEERRQELQIEDFSTCDIKSKTKLHEILELVLICIMLGSGIATMVFTLIFVVQQQKEMHKLL